MNKPIYDIVIAGAGPAGLTAALYAGRSRLKTRILEKFNPGGQILLTETIENFPGIFQMKSVEWVGVMRKQLADLKEVEISEEASVKKIEAKDGLFKTIVVSQADRHEEAVESKAVIIATGAQPKKMGIPGEDALTGRGVSYCATCDGPLYRDKEVVVVGGGDTAIEEALYLRKFAKKITVVHRREALRATAVLRERVLGDEKIVFQWDSVPLEVVGKMRVEGLRVRNVKNNQENTLSCDGVFVFIGFTPDTAFLRSTLDLSDAGYILTDENMMSSATGIFACGDCRLRPFSQVVTACGEGAIAAFAAAKFLENKI
jgi:thioredoxin reductase (NADPH)